ncbi:uncharacterized protein A1O9_05887 [Exophiala aquamarina CBS 119918]|uniref:Ecp2 effector protein domain-containing protein n=1 Tax=Exophiala aquamarina CBS 119918 TaxID=1182545 RepID=A0A072PR08_9EURO|nr:uncharacterized protein A1O9_05887 [Exophiala aquamarina CBS 119918]KEF57965.1 hypothetical protein A1O9_05887 [Exophiala aquamarina CBS 119918]
MLFVLFVLTQLLAFAHAATANACDWVGATPVLYHQYDGKSCPPPRHLQENNVDCEWRVVPDDHYSCDSFCQMRTNFFYTMETPIFSNPYCYGPVICSVGANDHIFYNGKLHLGASVESGTLDDGVSGGWLGLRQGNTVSQPLFVSLGPNECGYFAFLPIVREVCGTRTWGKTHNHFRQDCGDEFHTTANACNSEILGANTGRSASAWGSGQDLKGDTIFVRTDCANHEPLPMDQQNPAYRHPGVAMPHDIREAYTAFWSQQKHVSCLAIDSAKTSCVTGNSAPRVADCVDALQNMMGKPGNSITSSSAADLGEGYTTLSKSGSCAVRLYYDDQFTRSSNCNINNIEIAAAAAKVLDKCAAGAGVRGKQPIRPDGTCGCHVVLEMG